MRARLLAILRGAWQVLAVIGGAAVALALLLFGVRRRGRQDEQLDQANRESRERIDRLQGAAARGNDDEAQRGAFEGIKPRGKR